MKKRESGGGPQRFSIVNWIGLSLAIAGGIAGLGLAAAPIVDPNPGDAAIAALLRIYARPADAVAPTPADNAITPDKVALGKILFFDRRLSGSGMTSCASCHDPAHDWQDGRPRGVGERGAVSPRRTQTLLDVAWAEPLFWDGRASTLEEQAKGPLSTPAEMNMPLAHAVHILRGIPGYRDAFARAYPRQKISVDTMVGAMASYERTMVSGVAPFDKWVAGDADAVSGAAKRGFVLFATKAKCAACHSGWRFTDDGFHDIGLPDDDMGRSKIVPGLPILDHAFKTPTLRNVAERAPYMHDGSIKTLDAVIDHYEQGFVDRPSLSPEMRRPRLSATEKTDLKAFLLTLTSHDAIVTPPTSFPR